MLECPQWRGLTDEWQPLGLNGGKKLRGHSPYVGSAMFSDIFAYGGKNIYQRNKVLVLFQGKYEG
jgi:hypothetical protein